MFAYFFCICKNFQLIKKIWHAKISILLVAYVVLLARNAKRYFYKILSQTEKEFSCFAIAVSAKIAGQF